MMFANSVVTGIAVVVGGGIVAVGAYYIVRYMRGTIKLSLSRTAFNPGDIIAGNFDLHTKKEIQGNKLIVSLIGEQVTKTHEGGKTRTRTLEIYRKEVILEEAKVYLAGFSATHDFKLSAPNVNTPEFLNSVAGQALSAALRLLSNRSTHFKWKVEARLDAKGVDLAASKSISININQLG